MSKQKWDLTSISSCTAAAEWIRKDAGALFVLVVRANDCAFVVDGEISPADAISMVECILPGVQEKLTADQLEARARVKAKAKGAMGMKALSVRSPWWWYTLHAGKDIENRDWPTVFRGTIALHASSYHVKRQISLDIIAAYDIAPGVSPDIHELLELAGHIVGMVDIVDCQTHSTSRWFFGRYGFKLANLVIFATPIRCKGMLGFFTLPEDVLAQVLAQKAGAL